ncbi:hypothetical protein BH23PLA1_BH23PLA1_22940 [soil metagenome]
MSTIASRPSIKAEALAAGVCALLGLLMGILPHLIWWVKDGDPVYLAEWDDIQLYLPISAMAYHDHPTRLGDMSRPTGGATIYPGNQMLPGVWIARSLGLGPLNIGLVWRLTGGISIGLAFYLLMRIFFRRPWVAAALAVFPLMDGGLFTGRLLIQQAGVTARLLLGDGAGRYLGLNPIFVTLYRVINPLLSLGYLLLHIAALAWARSNPTWPRLLLAGVLFGLLFHIYFFYWTAALLGLAIAWALDAGHRRVYFHTGWIGALVGLPGLVSSYLMKQSASPDWGIRTDLWRPEAGRTHQLAFDARILTAAVLLAFLFYWVWTRRRDLIHLWSLATAGLLLVNHQLLTNLINQNWHYNYVWGTGIFLLLLLSLAHPFFERERLSRKAVSGLAVAVVVMLGWGFSLRALEATRFGATQINMLAYEKYREQRLRDQAPPLLAQSTIFGDGPFVDLALIHENLRPLSHYSIISSAFVSNEELDLRDALNHYLLGLDRPTYEAEHTYELGTTGWGPWTYDPNALVKRKAERLAAFDAVARDPEGFLDRFGVRYAVLEANSPRPPLLRDGWQVVQDGPHWTILERVDSDSAPARGRREAAPDARLKTSAKDFDSPQSRCA